LAFDIEKNASNTNQFMKLTFFFFPWASCWCSILHWLQNEYFCVMNRIENTVDIINKFSISNLFAIFSFSDVFFKGSSVSEYIKNLLPSILSFYCFWSCFFFLNHSKTPLRTIKNHSFDDAREDCRKRTE
jgi:hypothetical protein